MKMSRRRSSPTSSSIASCNAVSTPSCFASSSRPSSSGLPSWSSFRRNASIARCFAVPMSQAPGLSGTPDSGHFSSAATSASCARSSATPTSRTIRVRPAMTLADSILQTASMARCVSVAVTATNTRHRANSGQGPRCPSRISQNYKLRTGSSEFVVTASCLDLSVRVGLDLSAQPVFLRSELRRELGAEILGLEDLANLDLRIAAERRALEPLDCLLLRLHLPDPEARDQLLGLRERAIDDRPILSRESHARALGAGLKSLTREHHSRLHQLFVELAHLRQLFLSRHDARFGVLVGFHQYHESHCRILILVAAPQNGGSLVRRTRPGQIDIPKKVFFREVQLKSLLPSPARQGPQHATEDRA